MLSPSVFLRTGFARRLGYRLTCAKRRSEILLPRLRDQNDSKKNLA